MNRVQRYSIPQDEVKEENMSFGSFDSSRFNINRSPNNTTPQNERANGGNRYRYLERTPLSNNSSTVTVDKIKQSILVLKAKLSVMWLIANKILFISIYQVCLNIFNIFLTNRD